MSTPHGLAERWIEGVGSVSGLLMERITGGALIFTCCLLNNEELYHSKSFESCYYVTGIDPELQKKQLVTIRIS